MWGTVAILLEQMLGINGLLQASSVIAVTKRENDLSYA